MAETKKWWLCAADKTSSKFRPVITQADIPLSTVTRDGKERGEILDVWEIRDTMKQEGSWFRPDIIYAIYDINKPLDIVWREFYAMWFWNRKPRKEDGV